MGGESIKKSSKLWFLLFRKFVLYFFFYLIYVIKNKYKTTKHETNTKIINKTKTTTKNIKKQAEYHKKSTHTKLKKKKNHQKRQSQKNNTHTQSQKQ